MDRIEKSERNCEKLKEPCEVICRSSPSLVIPLHLRFVFSAQNSPCFSGSSLTE